MLTINNPDNNPNAIATDIRGQGSLLSIALKRDKVILSQMGPHAGEDERTIFERKGADTDIASCTYWLHGSAYARPDDVQRFTSTGSQFVIFITSSGRAEDMLNPNDPHRCTEYSHDRYLWRPLPRNISAVTGSKTNARRYGLVLEDLEWYPAIGRMAIDLWDYARDDFAQDKPIRGGRGLSTVCAVRKDMSTHPQRINSNRRFIVGVGVVAQNGGVWLR